MATRHRLGNFDINLWRGQPPPLVQEQVASATRAGADGVTMQRLGIWSPPFEVEIVSHYASYLAAIRDAARLYAVRRQLLPLKYETLDYAALFKHLYSLDAVELVSCKTMIRLLGPGYNYPAGGELVMRLRMTPHFVP